MPCAHPLRPLRANRVPPTVLAAASPRTESFQRTKELP